MKTHTPAPLPHLFIHMVNAKRKIVHLTGDDKFFYCDVVTPVISVDDRYESIPKGYNVCGNCRRKNIARLKRELKEAE